MPRQQTRSHEPAPENVQQDFRRKGAVYRYMVVGQAVDTRGVRMLRCTFCNKVWQGTQYYATKHFTQPQYCKKVSDEALFDIAHKCTHRFEADQAERVRHYAQERWLDVPRSGAMGGEAEWSGEGVGGGEDTQRWSEGGSVRDGAGAGVAEEGEAGVDREGSMAKGERTVTGEGAVPEVDPVTRQRTRGWDPVGKRPVPPEIPSTPSSSRTPVRDTPGSSKRKDGGADLPATQAGKRLRQQRVTLQHPGGGPLPVLPSHSEIASVRAVEIHLQELAEELEEVRQPFWSSGATLLSDGRKSRDGRPIVNFLAAGSRGVVMYMTINREGEPDDSVHVLQRWVTIFHDFRFGGPQLVNAICTDSASAYVGVARALADATMPPELRRITWLLWSVHVCNKLLSDIGTICTSFVDTITRARVLVVFFKTHQAALSFFRRCTGGALGLVLSCETRFASVYSMLERLLALQDRLQDMMRGVDGQARARIPWSRDVSDMACSVRRQIRWSPWWERMRAILHVMESVMELLRRIDRGGQFMSLVVEWTQDLACLVRDACAPFGHSFSDRVMRHVQARIHHMMEPAYCEAFLLNPRRRDVQYFSAQLDEYHTWLVRQAKRYLLSQTGFDVEGAPYLEVCRQFEDFHMQQAERNWVVHESIHAKKNNQLAFEKVVHLVEITANVWLMEYRRAGCGYVLPWQRDEGMLDAQAGIELDPVRSGMKSSMTPEEIEEQAAVTSRDPIGCSAPPPTESVFGARVAIFWPYPRDHASGDERERECANDPVLPIPREIDELHEEVEREAGVEVDDRAQVEREAGVEVDDRAQVEREAGVEVDDGAHVEREAGVEVDDRAQVETEVGVEVDDCAQVEREEDVVTTQVGREEGVAVPSDAAQGERQEDVVRADGIALVEGEDTVVEGGVAHDRGEGSDTLDPTVERFIADERTSSRHSQEPPGFVHGTLFSTAREHPQEEHDDAAAAEIPGGSGPLVHFVGMQLTTTTRPVRPCVLGSGSEKVARDEVPPVVVVDLGSEPPLQTSVSGRRAPEDTACPFDAAELARAAVRNVIREEDTYSRRPRMPPPPPRSRHGDSPSTPAFAHLRSPSTPGRPRVRDTTGVGILPFDTTLFRRTDIDLDSTRRVTVHTARLQPGLGGGGTGRGAAWEVMAAVSQPRHVHGGVEAESTLQHALAAAARAVRDQTSRRSAAYRDSGPCLVPAAGGAALGESLGPEGLGMPRGSRRDKTVEAVTRASTRLVHVRRGDERVIVEEDDPETEPARDEDPNEDDEYREDDESREEERDDEEEEDDDDDDEPSPRPRRGSGRRQEEFRETRPRTRSRGPSAATEVSQRGVSRTGGSGRERRRGSGRGKRGRWS
ncbi:hypothetical protein CBR_g34044 [Chara braunii]|uniref:DUF659 domain-containing protein n=1 Tax=Chara braunii TaxID=69332 RepID=A0A388LHX8_CHABU|nr:hypothetical protein CBR_g34044 [Chara braunii]|eukprot:GBG81861.1 hypothetical protein CBR_g34044 [Chara braunii]